VTTKVIGVTTKAICAFDIICSRTILICSFRHHALGAHTPTVYYAAISRFSCLFAKKIPRRGP